MATGSSHEWQASPALVRASQSASTAPAALQGITGLCQPPGHDLERLFSGSIKRMGEARNSCLSFGDGPLRQVAWGLEGGVLAPWSCGTDAPRPGPQAFQRQIHERLTQLELINKQYRRLARENRTDTASKLKQMVHEGNQRWDNLQKRVTAILRRLRVTPSTSRVICRCWGLWEAGT